jgi:hypothetical protein
MCKTYFNVCQTQSRKLPNLSPVLSCMQCEKKILGRSHLPSVRLRYASTVVYQRCCLTVLFWFLIHQCMRGVGKQSVMHIVSAVCGSMCTGYDTRRPTPVELNSTWHIQNCRFTHAVIALRKKPLHGLMMQSARKRA